MFVIGDISKNNSCRGELPPLLYLVQEILTQKKHNMKRRDHSDVVEMMAQSWLPQIATKTN